MKRKLKNNQFPPLKIVKKHVESKDDDWCCLLDLNYSSKLLSTKIADIPHKVKYETIIAPIFEYCFGTSDQDIVGYFDNETSIFDSDVYESNIINLKIDWIRDETFIYSKLFTLSESAFITLAREFQFFTTNRKFILKAICYFTKNFWTKLVQHYPLIKHDFEIVMAAVKEDVLSLNMHQKN